MSDLADARSIHSSGSSSWPSQLEVVEQILRNFSAQSKVHVQKMSGDQPLSIAINGEATLKDLKAAIVEAEGLTNDLSVSLLLGATCVRDEFILDEMRWKSLREYGIDDGSTLGMITQPRLADAVVVIALQKSSDGDLWPIEIDTGKTLDDLKAIICAKEGLTWQTFDAIKMSIRQEPSQNGIRCGISSDRSLADHGIEEGTTLVYKLARPPLSEVTNSANSQSVPTLQNLANVAEAPLVVRSNDVALTADRHEPPLIAHSDDFQQHTDDDSAFAQPQTPPPRTKIELSRMPSVCKESRSRELRAKKMLKRL